MEEDNRRMPWWSKCRNYANKFECSNQRVFWGKRWLLLYV